VIAYLQLIATMTGTWYLPGGNQLLCSALGAHLQREWGVELRSSSTVEEVAGDETGVNVTSGGHRERFDEVILAAPPEAIRALLPASDPLLPLLARFSNLEFRTQAVRLEGVPARACVFDPAQAQQLGKTAGLQAQLQSPGWYISAQYSSNQADDELAEEVRSTARALGATEILSGPSRRWSYFPHVKEGTTQTLRSVEALQGQRHVWTTGSWLSFETIEHTARHARHLVQTAFDPAGPRNTEAG
jgi:predicted NAD/FAD-binding protein